MLAVTSPAGPGGDGYLTVRVANRGGGQVQRGFVDDELQPALEADSSSSTASSRALGLFSIFWLIIFLSLAWSSWPSWQ